MLSCTISMFFSNEIELKSPMAPNPALLTSSSVCVHTSDITTDHRKYAHWMSDCSAQGMRARGIPRGCSFALRRTLHARLQAWSDLHADTFVSLLAMCYQRSAWQKQAMCTALWSVSDSYPWG
jgi:hypothetical protein